MKYYTNIDINGHLALDYAQIVEGSNTYNNLSTSNISFIKFSGSTVIVTGFANGGDNNKILVVSYTGNGTLTLKNLSILSTSTNRIITGYNEDLILNSGNNAILIYDSYEDIWRVLTAPSVLSLPQGLDTTDTPTFDSLNLFSINTVIIDVNNSLEIDSTGDITLTPAANNGSVIINSDTASTLHTDGALVVNGGIGVAGNVNASGSIKGSVLISSQSSGNEGGQIELALAASNTTLNNGVHIDVYQNRLRIFEAGGNNRGVYIDLTAATNGVGTNLIAAAGAEIDTLESVTARGASSTYAITLSNTTESSSITTGALIVSGGIGVAKRINTLNLTVNGIKQRAGVSPELDSAVINLSSNDYLIYYIDQTEVSGFLADISFTNGTAGENFYVKIKSNGNQYTWDDTNGYIKFPSDVIPAASATGKTDLYHFICVSTTLYLGTYILNYA